jgi:hypothetical protein
MEHRSWATYLELATKHGNIQHKLLLLAKGSGTYVPEVVPQIITKNTANQAEL